MKTFGLGQLYNICEKVGGSSPGQHRKHPTFCRASQLL